MEKREKRTVLIKTRNGEFERYESDIKVLYAKYGAICKYVDQHHSAVYLERRLKQWAFLYGKELPISYDIRTGTGIVVEYGILLERG